ncbi:autotransporter-associated beta strand repeat-containing protein, partial [Pseudomonas sp. Marseille-P9899]|uniref:autotransporter-associated beta strand repeat-containing protein n=1 Tax=Pseudomonas sp. Marseille-P9899 TaxID=2730401 RepID=UPI00158ECBFE
NVASATAPLTVGGLSLASTSNLNFTLGAPNSATSMVKVNGNLTLDGLLNISNGGGFGPGVYQLFSYGGSLTNNGLDFGSLPSGILAAQLELQTSIANQINLVVGEADGNLVFWNGSKTSADGTISGGSGTWGADTNWTNSSGSNANGWSGGQFAVFGGQKGTVTVSGQRVFSGIQFLADGYNLVGGTGDSLEAVNAADGTLAALRVANSATAVIDAAIVGEGGIQKLDGGTVVLNGANTYSGGTQISAGTLQGNTTSLQGSIVNDASLIFQQNVDGRFGGTLGGTGNAIKRGLGNLLFTGYNDFSGTFTVEEGVLQVGETVEEEPAPVVASFARMALFAAPVGDTLAADITVNSGAALTGTGTVNSVVNNGTVQPGANGNLTVTGDFTNTSNGTLNINLTPLPTSYLAVGGTANLAGELNVFAVAPYAGDTTYTLLTADGGI